MGDVQQDWKAYLAEMQEVDPKLIPKDNVNNYRLFCAGWKRAVEWCTNLLKEESSHENFGIPHEWI